jgi:cytochrome P450
VTHRLTDDEILGFAFLLLAAGSGTTWKQLGITTVALLQHPEWLEAVRDDATVLRPVIEESLRWTPTDPMFSRFVARDTELGGVAIPAGGVMHICLAAANRDPSRWEHPDEFDPSRPPQAHIGFGDGAHICLGMHVARAEMATAIEALVSRLPNLRLDPDVPAPRIIGLYERGPTAVPVRFG